MGYNSGAIVSFSKNDTIKSSLSHSSTEAEIKAIDEMIQEIEYKLEIFDALRINISRPVKIYCDNKSSITLCETLKNSHKTKSINMRIHYIRNMINDKVVSLNFCSLTM